MCFTVQVPEVIEDSGDALHLLWAATPPFLKETTPGPAAPAISRSVVQLMSVFLTDGGPAAAEAVVASGAVAPAVHVGVLGFKKFWLFLRLFEHEHNVT